jgi:uncharacterized membrane protein (DUF2068 family)
VTPARGERLIALYKALKGALQLMLAATVIVLVLTGRTASLPDALEQLAHTMSRAWSADLLAAIARVATRGHLELTAAALAADGILTSIEGWALWRGHWWGRWVVVVATGCLIPFEVAAIVRHVHAPIGHRVFDVAALVVNIVIVAYLARHAWRHHVERVRRKPVVF